MVLGFRMGIELVGPITQATTIAIGGGIRELDRLVRVYGVGRWRKRKGMATVRLPDGSVCRAEVHWYEAHGIGRKDMKVKRIVENRG